MEENNKAIMKKIVEIFNTGDLSEVDSMVSADYIDHQNDQDRAEGTKFDGPELFKQIVIGARKHLPNLKVTIEDLIVEENKVVARLRWHSVDQTKKIDRETIDILLIIDGKVTEHWGAEEWNTGRE